MNTSKEEGTPLTINSAGRVVPKPSGPSRWASPRRYACKHDGLNIEGCENAAVLLVQGPWPHNCCAQHGKEWGLE